MFLVQKYLPPSSFVPPFLVLEFVACFLENKPDEVTKRLPKKSKTYLNRYNAVEKKPPLTTSRKANGGPVVALFLAEGKTTHYQAIRYHKGGGVWKSKSQ
jgi:hypothetical protein